MTTAHWRLTGILLLICIAFVAGAQVPQYRNLSETNHPIYLRAPFEGQTKVLPFGFELRLHAPRGAGSSLVWSNGSTTPEIVVTNSGWVWVEVTHRKKSVRDSLFVKAELPLVRFPAQLQDGWQTDLNCLLPIAPKSLLPFDLELYDFYSYLQHTWHYLDDCWSLGNQGSRLRDSLYYWRAAYDYEGRYRINVGGELRVPQSK